MLAASAVAQMPPSWTRAVKPVRVVGNIYYVGPEELGSYLLAGKDGLSHAHVDHAGGFAIVKKKTGAKLYLSAPDAELAARGGKNEEFPRFLEQAWKTLEAEMAKQR